MQRYEKLELPKEALREILYNAIAHKDYTGAHIQMHVYNDSVEIWNEGELPEGYTQETLFARHSSKPRNLKIANAFFKAGFIDTWGRGFQKIRDGFEREGLPMPKIENFCGGVRVTIERTNFIKLSSSGQTTTETSSQTGSQTSSQTDSQTSSQRIIELIRENNTITTQAMADILGISRRAISKHTAKLQAQGILQRVGGDFGGHWEIIENDK